MNGGPATWARTACDFQPFSVAIIECYRVKPIRLSPFFFSGLQLFATNISNISIIVDTIDLQQNYNKINKTI